MAPQETTSHTNTAEENPNQTSTAGQKVAGATGFVTTILGNAAGGVSRTAGTVAGAAATGLGDTVNNVAGEAGKPVGNGLGSIGSGVSEGVNSVAKGMEDAGNWNKDSKEAKGKHLSEGILNFYENRPTLTSHVNDVQTSAIMFILAALLSNSVRKGTCPSNVSYSITIPNIIVNYHALAFREI
ncbi:hypothetical protein E4U50_007670 [Claviceps purpurea]|nr:hypothetical protein E4U50_007670 [Claviceps purpurea]